MSDNFKSSADGILQSVTSDEQNVPAVVAMVTDREGIFYEGASGYQSTSSEKPISTNNMFALFSTTKAITGTAVLQLVEQGLLDLDAPAANYVPEIGTLQVIEGFGENAEPVLRPPKNAITTRMLLLHTAGFAYDFFNETYHRLAEEHEQPSVVSASRECLMTPLLFDPGEGWEIFFSQIYLNLLV